MATEKKVPVEPGKEVTVEGVDKPEADKAKPAASKPAPKGSALEAKKARVGTAVEGAVVVPVVVHVYSPADLSVEEQAKNRALEQSIEDKEKEDDEQDEEKDSE